MVSPQMQAKIQEVSNTIVARINADRQAIAVKQQANIPVDTQIEAWKTKPKEQALKELTELSKSRADPPEKRIELEIIRTKADLMGALQPEIKQSMQVLSIEIKLPGQRQECEVINITPGS